MLSIHNINDLKNNYKNIDLNIDLNNYYFFKNFLSNQEILQIINLTTNTIMIKQKLVTVLIKTIEVVK